MTNVSARLPQFPWDRLKPYAAMADAHPGGRVDLSVGTPVDPTPQSARRALAAAADAPGYPTTHGTGRLRDAAADWMRRALGASVDPVSVLPLIGSKELVAGLPALLGLGVGAAVAYPAPAYPTYEIGALLCGASPVPVTDGQLLDRWIGADEAPEELRLLWLNSPGNPHGRVHSARTLGEIVAWARARGVLVVADECYISLGWEATEPVSVLHPDVCGGAHGGLLAVHSLSKRSNLAGYRSAFLAGDPAAVAQLLEVRKHAGMMMPAPVQAATAAALDDDEHAAEQKERYRSRRLILRAALEGAGFRIDHSEAGLYLWASRVVDGQPQPCWDTVAHLADLGILVAPGAFYGPGGEHHVRVALTATDERVAAAAARLGA
ncbi:succinyldiaminopimelate transaminase [Actinocrinis puniceicyclus]|uniref:Succinyldiaminopimelate transaminase n=1 Tax=Actinocrinis puniceicyclus TaxID=977794 RepID=A0A8J7WTI0_9ACTN|nr:succinyldiaminopimelate transaminase [Actinocrinis puniceicyclus]MBS2964909.1 succinyldiaminopimelate transaminase [Actinocrinis puniceicyclus]